ncbi:hypothetical protein [Mycobacterium sp. UM_Kg1]|uniref:hypothetical protein n=1 Tax=Mycobacterium sp. UM_Kg1 TaxID=1545691 RepID=UPI00128E567B|nr:hypothetical protein [Mycobacterium sp. UM_Kg1]
MSTGIPDSTTDSAVTAATTCSTAEVRFRDWQGVLRGHSVCAVPPSPAGTTVAGGARVTAISAVSSGLWSSLSASTPQALTAGSAVAAIATAAATSG